MMLLSLGLVDGEVGKPFVGEPTAEARDPGGDDAWGMFSGLGIAVPTVV